MGFILFLLSALVLAVGLLGFLGEEDPLEQASLAFLLAFAALVAANWALAACGFLTWKALVACTVGFAMGGMGLLYRNRPAPGTLRSNLSVPPGAVAVLAAPALAGIYVIVRGSVMAVEEFDALSYHLPKAVEIMRAQTIPFIPSGDFRIPYFPWNYEVLLADGLILAHGDQQSFWIGLLPTLGLLACAGAIFRRSWPRLTGLETLLGVLFVASTPVLILHSGALKNDALFSFFLLCTLHWTVRWSQEGGRKALFLALVSLALAFGTKSTALFLLPVMGFALWHYRSKWPFRGTARAWFTGLGFAGLAVVLSGSAWPLLNVVWSGHPLGETAMVGGISGFQSNAVPNYLGFSNLWKFPILAVLRPFSSSDAGVWVFWKHEYWYWPAYNGIYGHFGWLCSALLLLVPFGILKHRGSAGDGSGYRAAFIWASLGFVVLSLPQGYRVDGMFATFPRYLLCVPVLVGMWSLLPCLLWIRGKGRGIPATAAGLALTLYFAGQAFLYLVNDSSKPLRAVVNGLGGTEKRPELGVESIVDQVAGPEDSIAYDSGYGGFVYHLYGIGLTRPLIYLPRHPGPIAIPPGVKWVVIDRTWNVGWSHAGATTTAEFMLPALGRGESPEDLALVNQMRRNRDFVEVFNRPRVNQWAFLARKYLPQEKS